MSRSRKVGMSDTEKEKYELVKQRTVIPTKFLDKGTLETLGLYGCMQMCLAKAGLGDFIDVYAPSYENLSKQFISTFRTTMDDKRIVSISFKYKGKAYTVTAEQAREAIGVTQLPTENWAQGITDATLCDFWEGATGQAYHMGEEYNNKITHPCLRLIHKLLQGTFLGHKEDNKVPLKDLPWLYCVLPQADFVPDWLQLVLTALRRIRQGDKRDITQGGLITRIAETVLQVGADEEPVLSHVFNVNRLRANHMLKIVKKHHFWCTYSDMSHIMALPREMPYSSTYGGWYLFPDPTPTPLGMHAADFLDDEPRPRRRRVAAGSSSRAPAADEDEEMHAAGQGAPPMDPWQDMMYRQMEAMSLQQQTWQQGIDSRFDGFQSQLGEFQSQAFQRMDRQDERLDQMDGRLQQLGEQQQQYFGQYPWPPGPPQQ